MKKRPMVAVEGKCGRRAMLPSSINQDEDNVSSYCCSLITINVDIIIILLTMMKKQLQKTNPGHTYFVLCFL